MIEISSRIIDSIRSNYEGSSSEELDVDSGEEPEISLFTFYCPYCSEGTIIMCENVYTVDFRSWEGTKSHDDEGFWTDEIDEWEARFVEEHLLEEHEDDYLLWVLRGKD